MPAARLAYTQALVDGYHVIIEIEGERYDYRVGCGGAVRLCEGRSARGRLRASESRKNEPPPADRRGLVMPGGFSVGYLAGAEVRLGAPLALSVTTSMAPRGSCWAEVGPDRGRS